MKPTTSDNFGINYDASMSRLKAKKFAKSAVSALNIFLQSPRQPNLLDSAGTAGCGSVHCGKFSIESFWNLFGFTFVFVSTIV